ncbi:MAG: LysM peptidoglycan-binding domain-containing protein, partial [Anaerolineae bacterium]
MKKRLLILIGLVLSIAGLTVPTTAQSCGTQVTVEAGDTLWDIARECNVTVPAILEANFTIFEPSELEIGEPIDIPDDQTARSPQVSVYPQSVRPGDRIQVIANGFPLTTEVRVSIGQQASEPSVSQTLQTDRQGAVITNMTVPPSADLNGRWVAIVETTEGQSYQATSFVFFINDETTQAPPVQ